MSSMNTSVKLMAFGREITSVHSWRFLTAIAHYANELVQTSTSVKLMAFRRGLTLQISAFLTEVGGQFCCLV